MMRQRKRYDIGGSLMSLMGGGGDPSTDMLSKSGGGGGGGYTLASMAGPIADAIDKPNKYGRQSMATNILKDAGTYSSMGAKMGSAFGPIGSGVGAAIGTTAGIVKGIFDTSAQKRAEMMQKVTEEDSDKQQAMSQYQSMAATDRNWATGSKTNQYMADGGSLGNNDDKSLYSEFLRTQAKGGNLSRMSSDSVEVKGPSHAQGGVQLPGGNEVEGKETIKGDYVFSSRLGFAQEHKPIAKAIGRLEQRPATAPVITSLRRLRDKEEALMLLQEQTKAQQGLQ